MKTILVFPHFCPRRSLKGQEGVDGDNKFGIGHALNSVCSVLQRCWVCFPHGENKWFSKTKQKNFLSNFN